MLKSNVTKLISYTECSLKFKQKNKKIWVGVGNTISHVVLMESYASSRFCKHSLDLCRMQSQHFMIFHFSTKKLKSYKTDKTVLG